MIAGVASIGGGGREFKSPVAGVALFIKKAVTDCLIAEETDPAV